MKKKLQKLRLYRGFPAIPEDTKPLEITEWDKSAKVKRVRSVSFYRAVITLLEKYDVKGLKAVDFSKYIEVKFTNDLERLEQMRDVLGIKAVFIYNIPEILSSYNQGILTGLVNHFRYAPDTEFIGVVYDRQINV